MYRAISLAVLVGGVVLLILGMNAADSLSSDISRFFTDSPTNKAIWMLVIGSVLCVVGLAGLVHGLRSRK
jgi:hypothetical protein